MVIKVVSILIGAFFVMAGSTKLMGMAPHPEHFAGWGYPDWFRLFVGAWETVFGILFMMPTMTKVAGPAIVLGMAGAVFTALTRDARPMSALFPMVLLVVVGLVTWVRIRRAP